MKKLAELLTAEHFDRTIAPFVRAMHNQVFDLRHASVILAHFDRFGPVFDQWARILAHDLKNDAIHANKADEVARIIVQSFKEVSNALHHDCYCTWLTLFHDCVGLRALSQRCRSSRREHFRACQTSRLGDFHSHCATQGTNL